MPLLPARPVARAHRGHALSRDARPDPDAPLDGRAHVTAVGRERQRGLHCEQRRARPSKVGRQRDRIHDDPGIEAVVGIPGRLPCAERRHELRAEHPRQQLAPRAPVAVLSGQRPAVGDDEVGCGGHEVPEPAGAARPVKSEPDAQVDASLAEVAVRGARQPVVPEQRAQLAQVGREPGRRDGGVLEPRPGRATVRQARGSPGALLADAPQHALRLRILDAAGLRPRQAGTHGRGEPRRVVPGLRGRLAAGLEQQPGTARRQEPGVPPRGQQVRREALGRERTLREEGRDCRRRRDVVREGEHEQVADRRHPDEAHRRRRDHRAGALGAGQRACDVRSTLWEQPVQQVPGDPARPGRQLAPDPRPVDGQQLPDPCLEHRPQRHSTCGRTLAQLPHSPPDPVGGDHLEAQQVLRRRSPVDAVGAAGIVADHPADGAPAMRGRVGADAEAVTRGGDVDVVEDRPGEHGDGGGRGVQRKDPCEVQARVHDEPAADRVAGDAGSRAAHRERDARLGRHPDHGRQVVQVARRHDGRGDHAVVRRVRRVQRPDLAVVANLAPDRAAEARDQARERAGEFGFPGDGDRTAPCIGRGRGTARVRFRTR